MKYSKYDVKSSKSLLDFEFLSEGPRGSIRKHVIFEPFENAPTIFNLGFGDIESSGEINDMVVSNNRDSQQILSTVGQVVSLFFAKYPACQVFATGSTQSRTRLYRIGIANNLEEIQGNYDVFGFIEGEWEAFRKGRDYVAFLIALKSH
jgi:hypothetical protein